MFRKPWQIWTSYFLILVVILAGCGWLTLRVITLDNQERLARKRAEQEEKMSLALWRMDSLAMPIIAAEAVRSSSLYRPYLTIHKGPDVFRIPSPLLVQPSENILLNFQCSADGSLISPQCPPEELWDWAISKGTSRANLQRNEQLRQALEQSLSLETLLAELPQETMPKWSERLISSSLEFSEQDPVSSPAEIYIQNSAVLPSQVPPGAISKNDFFRRGMVLNQIAQQQRANQDQEPMKASDVREGVSRPLWLDGKLLLARRVEHDHETIVQGCWLNWDRLHQSLQEVVRELFPGARLSPVNFDDQQPQARMLASLPIRLDVPEVATVAGEWTPLSLSLAFAWAGLLGAFVSLGIMLLTMIRLSERRVTFVSAVTHELRTPLTTFQLYTDLLSQGIVSDPGKQSEYLQTLQRESNRLGHLIDNVLAFTKLERNRSRLTTEQIGVQELIARIEPRLVDRARQAGLALDVTIASDAAKIPLSVEPTMIEQILLNLVDNACKYGRNLSEDEERAPLSMNVTADASRVSIAVRDHGPGLAEDVRRRLFRPFAKSDREAARSAPGIGLGLSISRELARQMKGDLVLSHSSSDGTEFLLLLPRG